MGLEMRPFFTRGNFWAYPVYAAVGGSFGYWLTGVQERQDKVLDERKRVLLDKRRRRSEREAADREKAIADGEPEAVAPPKKHDGYLIGSR